MKRTMLALLAVLSLGAGTSAAIAADADKDTSTSESTSTSSSTTTTSTTETDEKIPADKKALIVELLKITEADKNVKLLTDELTKTEQKSINTILNQFIDENPNLTDAQKKEAKTRLDKEQEISAQRFKDMFDKEIDLPAVVNEVALKVYNRHFTDSELQDIITFYKSPTGVKAMKMMPQISQESMEEATRLIMPKMQSLLTRYIKERAASLEKK